MARPLAITGLTLYSNNPHSGTIAQALGLPADTSRYTDAQGSPTSNTGCQVEFFQGLNGDVGSDLASPRFWLTGEPLGLTASSRIGDGRRAIASCIFHPHGDFVDFRIMPAGNGRVYQTVFTADQVLLRQRRDPGCEPVVLPATKSFCDMVRKGNRELRRAVFALPQLKPSCF